MYYIYSIVISINALCNIIFIIVSLWFIMQNAVVWTYKKHFLIAMIIGLIWVVFIPNEEALKIILWI